MRKILRVYKFYFKVSCKNMKNVNRYKRNKALTQYVNE